MAGQDNIDLLNAGGAGERDTLARLAAILTERGWTCGTAESCTGGLIGAAITAMPGSSGWYRGGVISYANEIKTGLLQVPEEMIVMHGAVSEAVALAMAEGACRVLDADVAVSVTGIAGPDGGAPEKPVGTVWIGWADRQGGMLSGQARQFLFSGGREAVRAAARREALRGLLALACKRGMY